MSGRDFDDIADINKFFDGEAASARPVTAIPERAGKPDGLDTEFSPFIEECPACRGTGKFRSWSGRIVGDCFKCKGQKNRTFKTSPEARAKARANNVVKAAERDEAKRAWREQHRDLIKWMEIEADRFRTGKTTFNFIHNMCEAIAQFGTLTDAQLAAVVKCKTNSDQRRAAWKAQNGQQDVAIDCTKIEAAFAKRRSVAAEKGAVGVKGLVLHFPNFSFSPDRRDPNVIWVNSKSHTNDRGLPAAFGKISNGKFSPFRISTPEIVAEIQTVAADPSKASRISGQNFGICCCCGATLTDPVSIENGIGPICAENWGF